MTEIIQSLNASEIRLIRKFYKIDGGHEEKKRLLLFDVVRKESVGTNIEAAQAIYGTKPDSKFSHLKARLRQDILGVMLLQEGETKFSAKYKQAEFNCIKLRLEGEVLLYRGAKIAGTNAIKEAAKLANQYDLTFEQLATHDLLREHLGFNEGLASFKKFESSIHENLELLSELLMAKEKKFYIGLSNLFFKNRLHEYHEYADKSVKELKESYKRIKSPHLGYYYYNVAIYKSEIDHDYKKGLDLSKEFLNLIQGHQAIYSKPREASAFLQIANMHMRLGEYKKAIKPSWQALELMTKESVNELFALEVLFYALINCKDHNEAQEVHDKARSKTDLKTNSFYLEKWLFFEANLKFCLGEYQKSLDILRKNTELVKDKAGYYLGWKFLEILNLVELRENEILYYRIDSFKKMLKRLKHKNIDRILSSFEIIEKLFKSNFDYQEVGKNTKEQIRKLEKGNNTFYWDPLGYEIVRFDDWFKEKLQNIVAP
ncbi:MAG: hypothetical protein IH946_03555 [Bacteroidetes bacterium]|nr:hypothetical protein [Bacteroidota bacterium]